MTGVFIMRIFETEKEAAAYCADCITDIISQKPSALICLAAGHTSLELFGQLICREREGKIDFSRVKVVGLDEWVGLSGRDDGSCENFLRMILFYHIKLSEANIRLFDSKADDLQDECAKIETFISDNGGIDYMLLGVGMNGHLGLNEPGTDKGNGAHIAKLDRVTQDVAHKYFKEKPELSKGVTLGIRNIAQTNTVQVLITDKRKSEIVKKIAESETNEVPASLIKNMKNVEFIVDQQAASLL